MPFSWAAVIVLPCTQTTLFPSTLVASMPSPPTPWIVESRTWMLPSVQLMPSPSTSSMIERPLMAAKALSPSTEIPSPVVVRIREAFVMLKRAPAPPTTAP